jgi:hypothetical protein
MKFRARSKDSFASPSRQGSSDSGAKKENDARARKWRCDPSSRTTS